MKRVIRIAKDLTLPLDAVTETFGIVAVKGAGKSTTAAVMVEQMLKAGAQVVVLDPTGAWWGIRSSADGRHEGLPAVIFGGDHADVPLDPAAGKVVADLIVDKRISVVIDLSVLRKAEQNRFVTAFAEELYHRNRKPLHLVVDEADAYIPQRPQHGEERMLGAFEDIVRRGRIKGIGITMITQRSAVINKNVLSQISTLIVMRTFAPQDRKAVEFWIEVHGDKEGQQKVMASLASLKIGEAWVWSPGWMKGLLKKVQINRRETFNSSATPKMGVRVREPKKLAPVDLAKIKELIADTIEKAKQEDPRELRMQIAALQRELAAGNLTVREAARNHVVEKVVEKKVPWLGKRSIKKMQEVTMRARLLTKHVCRLHESLGHELKELVLRLEQAADRVDAPIRTSMEALRRNSGVSIGARPLDGLPHSGRTGAFDPPAISGHSAALPPPDPATIRAFRKAGAYQGIDRTKMDKLGTEYEEPLMAGERRMIGVLKAFHPRPLTKVQMTTLAGLTPNSGTTSNYIRKLLATGIISGPKSGPFVLANQRAPSIDMPTGRNGFRAMWNAQLMAGERRLLDLVLENREMDKADLLERAGLTNSGTTANYLRKLKRCGLIEIEGQTVRQSPEIKELIG